jgi:hypothetical protein
MGLWVFVLQIGNSRELRRWALCGVRHKRVRLGPKLLESAVGWEFRGSVRLKGSKGV